MSADEIIEAKDIALGQQLEYCDNHWNIPIWKLANTGLFDSLAEIEVFFFSFDVYYYSTDIAVIKRLGKLYLDMIDEQGINRLFYV